MTLIEAATVAPLRTEGGRLEWLVGLAVTAVGLAIRATHLGQPMRFDEAVTYERYVATPLNVAAGQLGVSNNHPLHSVLAHLATSVFGGDPWAIRLVAFVAGSLLVPLTWLVATRLFGSRVGLLAAALVVGSAPLVEYATNARGYTLQADLFLLALLAAYQAVCSGRLRPLLLSAALSALGTFTIPTMLYAVATIAIWYVLLSWRRPSGHGWPALSGAAVYVGASGGLTLLLYAYGLRVTGFDTVFGRNQLQPESWGDLPAVEWHNLTQVASQWLSYLPLPVALLAVGLAAYGLWAAGNTPARSLALAVVLGAGGMTLVQRVEVPARVWLFLLPLFWTLVALGLDRAVSQWRAVAAWWRGTGPSTVAAALALALSGWVLASGVVLRSTETGTFPEAEAMAAFLAPRLVDQVQVLTLAPTDAPLDYYLRRRDLPVTASRIGTRTRTVYVVTQPTQSLPEAMDKANLGADQWHPAELVGEVGQARVYQLTRLAVTTP